MIEILFTCISEKFPTMISFSTKIVAISVSGSPTAPRARTKCPLGYWEPNSHESILTTNLGEKKKRVHRRYKVYVEMYKCDIHPHHQIMPKSWIPLILSHHLSQSAIALSMSFRQHPVSVQSWWMEIIAGQTTLVCPCVRVHRRKSLVSLSQ